MEYALLRLIYLTCALQIYGLEQSVARYTSGSWFLQPKQSIAGLYLSGQDAMTNGVGGALCGGVLCAIAVDVTVIIDLIVSFFMAI